MLLFGSIRKRRLCLILSLSSISNRLSFRPPLFVNWFVVHGLFFDGWNHLIFFFSGCGFFFSSFGRFRFPFFCMGFFFFSVWW
ncbi:hypothetical protein CROQUDRAFT_165245 [Cronartium quercuum f. sp. fusiforme G11]|uniref:Uncharacterized protein n=1 Tax=Cronartium quercuum f. sp. fusiforme G11 TaxID=708437 RepID=A0A9P6NBV0_9BASI|nr:hypothetical protein CROQUDRAFT_165245 [Cronartium quercuum f. sp. fusiforme G11]